jgi:hypothetical protein
MKTPLGIYPQATRGKAPTGYPAGGIDPTEGVTMTATATKALSDTDPHEWPNALENAFGPWEDLLTDPDKLDARAADLRTGDEIDERDNSLEDHLDELLSDPERLEARAAAIRAFEAATEASKKRWGIDGAAFMAGDADALAPTDPDRLKFYAVSYVTGVERGRDQLTELVEHLGEFIHDPDNLCDACDARLRSHLKAAFAAMRAEQA